MQRLYNPHSTPCNLFPSRGRRIFRLMRAISLVPLMMLLSGSCSAQEAFGTWNMNPARSTLIWSNPRSITVRIEPHAKGEVFTYERISNIGQAETFSVILYLDGQERDWQGSDCSGTLLSRRLDSRTVEIVWNCDNGGHTRFIRRMDSNAHDLMLDQTTSRPNRRGLERHLVLEKQ
jgi:hypothetical protein